jgi:hypothetical protein
MSDETELNSELELGQQMLADLESGEVSPEMRMAVAQGLLPLEQHELIQVLFRLCADPVAEIAQTAQRSLHELPDSAFTALAESTASPARLLHALARLKMDAPLVLRRLVVNRAAEDQTIAMIARSCQEDEVLSLVAGNQERLLRHPVLFELLLENMALSEYRRQQLGNYRQELLDRGQLAQPAAPQPAAPEAPAEPEAAAAPEAEGFDLDLIADFELEADGPFSASEMVPFHVYAGIEQPSAEQREMSLSALLSQMRPQEKLRMAQFGNGEARSILVREGDRRVAMAVLKNPRLQESELEKFVKMRNINEEVLRGIGANRKLMSNYAIVLGLVSNPKTPAGISVGLLPLVREQHIKTLERSREIPAALRSALKQRAARKAPRPGGGH